MKPQRYLSLVLFLACACSMHAESFLANNTILIVRHAEKPAEGTGLTARGEERARLYATYFVPFREEGQSLTIDSLFAGADSKNSVRPRLTLEPLAKATGLPLHHEIGTKDTQALVSYLKGNAHGQRTLISWRHGEIPNLIRAFGGDPDELFPNGVWPDDVFDWVIELSMNSDGKVVKTHLIREHLHLDLPSLGETR